MNTAEIKQIIEDKFGTVSLKDYDLDAPQPWLEVEADEVKDICLFLREDSRTYFDMLSCLSGIDFGPDQNELGVVYHLASVPHGHTLVLKIKTPRDPNMVEEDEAEAAEEGSGLIDSKEESKGLKGKLMSTDSGLKVNTGPPSEARPEKVDGAETFGEPFWSTFTEELMRSGMPGGFLKEVFGAEAPEISETESKSTEKKKKKPGNPLGLPSVPSVAEIWRTAEWHEREAFDLLGIWFDGHPDMRRILLPADWEGHPLRKDYETAENYHGIRIDY